ncbi:MAG TPA: hypothetical protein V6C89_12650 [Drouetiella sp.]
MQTQNFGFGIEAEFLLVDRESFRPLGYSNLDCQSLLDLVDTIPTDDCSRQGFNKKPLHNEITPYLIEGYTLTDPELKPLKLLPKGIEIRTPLTDSIENCTVSLNDLYSRLKKKLLESNMDAAMISYHPTEARLDAPRNYKCNDYWQWALTATTTYGPDINISLPPHLEETIDLGRIAARVNYYAPSAIALTLASPIREGGLWRIDNRIGKSVRTFERSKWAPIFYVHEKPSLRFEFKGFEMSTRLTDYHAMFLIGLALLLDENLDGTDTDESRITALETIAVTGLENSEVQNRAIKVLESAEKIASQIMIDNTCLSEFWDRLNYKFLPSDKIAESFIQTGSIEETLRTLSNFETCDQTGTNNPRISCCA